MSCEVQGLYGQNLRPHAGLECLCPIQQQLSGPIKEWPREHGEFCPVLPSFTKTVVMRRESEGRVVIKDKDTSRDIALYIYSERGKVPVDCLLRGASIRVKRFAALTLCRITGFFLLVLTYQKIPGHLKSSLRSIYHSHHS